MQSTTRWLPIELIRKARGIHRRRIAIAPYLLPIYYVLFFMAPSRVLHRIIVVAVINLTVANDCDYGVRITDKITADRIDLYKYNCTM